MSYLVPLVVAAAGLVLLLAVAGWLLVVVRRFAAFGARTSTRLRHDADALRARADGLRAAVGRRRATGTWRFTARSESSTIVFAQE